MAAPSDYQRRAHNRDLALRLAAVGIAVFPSLGKVPLVLSWTRLDTAIGEDGAEERRAEARIEHAKAGTTFDESTFIGSTTNVETVKKMWRKYRDAVPSISLGPSGLYALDADISTELHGPTLLSAWLAEQGIDTTLCPITISQSGARHILFKGPGLKSHVGKLMKSMYVQVKAAGNQVVAPGAIRTDGKVYTQLEGHPGLASAFVMDELPTVPPALVMLQTEREASESRTNDADTAKLIERLKSADPADPLHAADFLADDKSSDRSAFRLSLANRMCRAGYDACTYLATVQEADEAGQFIGDASPGEGEYNLRNVARDWRQAEHLTAAEKANAIDGSAFGDVGDTIEAAAKAVASAIKRGEDPAAEEDRLRKAIGMDDDATPEARALALAIVDPLATDLSTLLGDLLKTYGAEPAADDFVPQHVRDARDKKAAKGSPLPWEDQETSARLMRSHRAEPLIEGVLEAGAISVVYGSSNVGKSFIVAGLGYAIVSGLPWHSHGSIKGAVLYVGLEGRSGFRRRVAALRSDTAPHCADPALFATTQVGGLNLTAEGSEASRVIATVREIEDRGGLPVRLIVIDTLAAVIAGSDENSGRDMGAFVAEIKKIATAFPTVHILVVHHTGKDQARGARGHSSLRAAVDTEIEILPCEIRVTKQRDMEFAAAIGFRLEGVDLGEDDQGRPLRSAVARLHAPGGAADGAAFGAVDDGEQSEARSKLSIDQLLILEKARETISEAGDRPVSPRAIVAAVRRANSGLQEATIRKTLSRRLIQLELLRKIGESYFLPQPLDARDSGTVTS